MTSFKEGVKVRGMRPETVLGMWVCGDVYKRWGKECTITSGVEGHHSTTSLHYSGAAFDVRTKDLTDQEKENIVNDLKEALPEDFDVVVESTHIHIEYQPKGE